MPCVAVWQLALARLPCAGRPSWSPQPPSPLNVNNPMHKAHTGMPIRMGAGGRPTRAHLCPAPPRIMACAPQKGADDMGAMPPPGFMGMGGLGPLPGPPPMPGMDFSALAGGLPLPPGLGALGGTTRIVVLENAVSSRRCRRLAGWGWAPPPGGHCLPAWCIRLRCPSLLAAGPRLTVSRQTLPTYLGTSARTHVPRPSPSLPLVQVTPDEVVDDQEYEDILQVGLTCGAGRAARRACHTQPYSAPAVPACLCVNVMA